MYQRNSHWVDANVFVLASVQLELLEGISAIVRLCCWVLFAIRGPGAFANTAWCFNVALVYFFSVVRHFWCVSTIRGRWQVAHPRCNLPPAHSCSSFVHTHLTAHRMIQKGAPRQLAG